MTSTPNLAKVILNENEDSAIFLGINHVDILKIDGMEFYHYFLIILTLDPGKLAPIYNERVGLFYTVESRDFPESDLVYFDKTKIHQRSIWETTVSASSECAYDTTIKNLGKLIKVPNYDRVDNQKSGKRIFIRKISSNSLTSIEKVLEFEQLYDNTFKYSSERVQSLKPS